MPEPSPEVRARFRTLLEEERSRRCPHCGGETIFVHHLFRNGHLPFNSLPAAWLHTCKSCGFTTYLTGDRERDLKARNVFGPDPSQ